MTTSSQVKRRVCTATSVQRLDPCDRLQMIKSIDLCAWQQVCNQLDLCAWTWVHGNKWTSMHGYNHELVCMTTYMLQTSHAWSNQVCHTCMVTKGTHMGSLHGYKRG